MNTSENDYYLLMKQEERFDKGFVQNINGEIIFPII